MFESTQPDSGSKQSSKKQKKGVLSRYSKEIRPTSRTLDLYRVLQNNTPKPRKSSFKKTMRRKDYFSKEFRASPVKAVHATSSLFKSSHTIRARTSKFNCRKRGSSQPRAKLQKMRRTKRISRSKSIDSILSQKVELRQVFDYCLK